MPRTYTSVRELDLSCFFSFCTGSTVGRIPRSESGCRFHKVVANNTDRIKRLQALRKFVFGFILVALEINDKEKTYDNVSKMFV